jgi:hypothetical protein
MPYAQSAVRDAAWADNRFCAKLAAAHRFGMFGARLQHPVPPPETLNVSLPYRGGTGRLNLLIESTGIKAEGESEWTARKHGGPKRRIWRKIHIGIEEKTLAALLGSNAAGLSSTTISRLKADWWDDYDRWQRRDLSTRRFVYIWADSV